jgi:hypothetical protein
VEKINNKFGRLEEERSLDGFEDWKWLESSLECD